MPVRSRGQLLAGIAALLGLCTAGAGCQSSRAYHGPAPTSDAFAIRPATGTPRRTLLSYFHHSPPEEAVPVQSAEFTGPQTRTPRPVARAGLPAGTVIATTMEPVQRVSAEQGPGMVVPAAAPPGEPAHGGLEVLGPAPSGGGLPPVMDLQPPGPVTIAVSDPGKSSSAEESPTKLPMPQLETGEVMLGPPHGMPGLHPLGSSGPPVPRELAKRALSAYIVEPPDILYIQGSGNITDVNVQPLSGQHLVRPDGTISLGVYGTVFAAGRTLDQIATDVASALQTYLGKKDLTVEKIKRELQVDVLAYNSKFYYVITDGGGYGAQVYRLPITGNETVLDALSQVNGLPAVSSKKKIWVARATPHEVHPAILPVDWCSLAKQGSASTNYQLFPGDRVYVGSDARIVFDSNVQKTISPIERLFGVTLLGSTTVNSIRNRGGGTGTGTGTTR
jgi:polysaccharide export outer membrane protein